MTKIRFTLKAFAFIAIMIACASAANAQATRTWVSGVGDDVNPCSRTAPCKTFAGAISKTAAGGEIDALDPGGFGTITITKSITIDGTKGAGFGSILAAGTTGVNVNDSASGAPNSVIVTLRNLSINGASTGTNGISVSSGKRVNIEECQIFGFTTNGISVNMTNGTATEIYISDTSIFNCQQGIRIASPAGGFANATMKNVKIERITADAVRLETNGLADIVDSLISFAANGINVTGGAGSGAYLVNTTVTHCSGSGINAAAGTSRIMHSSILACVTGISFSGGSVRTLGDNNFDGNLTPFSGGGLTGIGGKL